MTIIIRNSDQPIYEQITQQIKNAILSGQLSAGDALPSIRGLAKDLRISVITTKRAYDELEQGGYIHTLPGKGSFVAEENRQRQQEEQRLRIRQCMREIWRLAPGCGLDREKVWALLRETEKEGSQ